MEDKNAVHIEIACTENDFDKFVWHAYKKRYRGKSLIYTVALYLIVFFAYFYAILPLLENLFNALLPDVSDNNRKTTWGLIQLPLIFLTLFPLINFCSKYKKNENVDKNGYFLAPANISIDTNGLKYDAKNFATQLKWQGVLSIDDTKDMIIIYVDTLNGYVIPKHNFKNDQEAAHFYEQAISFWQHSKNKTGKNPWGQPTDDSAQAAITTQDKDNNESGI